MRRESGPSPLAAVLAFGMCWAGSSALGQPATPTDTPTPSPVASPTLTPTSIRTEDLSISKTASPNPVAPGQLLTYTFDVTNHGIGLTLESGIMDTLPPEVTFVSCTVVHPNAFSSCNHSSGGSGGSGGITANLGPLGGGGTLSLIVVVRVVASSGTITNTATTGHNGPDPNPSNNTSTVVTTILGPPPVPTPTPTPLPPATPTLTPTALGGGAAGGTIPTLLPGFRIAFLLGLLAAGWFLASRRA